MITKRTYDKNTINSVLFSFRFLFSFFFAADERLKSIWTLKKYLNVCVFFSLNVSVSSSFRSLWDAIRRTFDACFVDFCLKMKKKLRSEQQKKNTKKLLLFFEWEEIEYGLCPDVMQRRVNSRLKTPLPGRNWSSLQFQVKHLWKQTTKTTKTYILYTKNDVVVNDEDHHGGVHHHNDDDENDDDHYNHHDNHYDI